MKNDGHVLSITTKSRMTTKDTPLPIAETPRYVEALIDDTFCGKKKTTCGDIAVGKKRCKGLIIEKEKRKIQRPHPSFPQ